MLTAHRKQLDPCAVQADFELVRLGEAENTIVKAVAVMVSCQADFHDVLGVGREVMPNRNSATRSEWEVFAHAVILHEVSRDIIGLYVRSDRWFPDGEATHLRRH